MPMTGSGSNALVPEIWAAESMSILTEKMLMANLVHRDFKNEVAKFGQIVHTRRPGEFVGRRKHGNEPVTVQTASATDIPVTLDQWVHVSFFLNDGEESLAFKDLAEFYLEPALIAQARVLDQSLAGQAVRFLNNSVSGLGGIDSTNIQTRIVDTRALMDSNKAYEDGRRLIFAPGTEAEGLKTDLFVSTERAGTSAALREANLGNLFGFDVYKSLNVPNSVNGTTGTAGTVSAAAVGSESIVSNVAVTCGQYFTCVGDMSPLRAETVDDVTAAWTIATTRPTIGTIAEGAVITPYATGTVDGTFANGNVGMVRVDGTGVPQVGRVVSFNDTEGGVIREPEYVIINVDMVSAGVWDLTLDRPLETALANDDVVNYGPNGDLNFAFHKNALALVNRPLALPMSGLVRAAVVEFEGTAIRVVITYDGTNQGHLVTIDSLFGVAVLNEDLGAVMLG